MPIMDLRNGKDELQFLKRSCPHVTQITHFVVRKSLIEETWLIPQMVEANLPEEDLHNFTDVNCTTMNATTFSMDELAQTLEES